MTTKTGGVTNGASSIQRGGFDVSTDQEGHNVDNLFERFARIPSRNKTAADGIQPPTESQSGMSKAPPAHSASCGPVNAEDSACVDGSITRGREIGNSSVADGDHDNFGGACGSDKTSCDESREGATTASDENNMRNIPRKAQAGDGVGGSKSPKKEEDPCVLSARSVNVGLGHVDSDDINDAGSITRQDKETSSGGAGDNDTGGGDPTKGTGLFVGLGYEAGSDSERNGTASPELVAGRRKTSQERRNGGDRGRRARSERSGRRGGGNVGGSVRKVDPDVQDIFARFMYTVP